MAGEIHHGFSGSDRSIVEEEELHLTSVGVDIGSSTSHLVFSRLTLERRNTRYVITEREVLRESEILLTPYLDGGTTIDADSLGQFIDRQYREAGLKRDEVDTGALILTGVAVRRKNSRAIGEIFAKEAGKFVAVSAGDGLEATMAGFGSGAADESAKSNDVVMNVDIGGGTSKIAICQGGKVLEVTAIDIGARLIAFDDDFVVTRIEEAGHYFAKKVGLELEIGSKVTEDNLKAIVNAMSDKLMEVLSLGGLSEDAQSLLRLPALSYKGPIDSIIFSGGVSEFIYGHDDTNYGDMGPFLADELKGRIPKLGVLMMVPVAGIRATVIGASQYTIQVSGSTIFIEPDSVVPVRNVPVIAPEFDLSGDDLDVKGIEQAVQAGLTRLDLADTDTAIAIGFRWNGSATFWRLDTFCKGIVEAMKPTLGKDLPLVLVSDGDIGGLLGLHLIEEMQFPNPVISIDGVDLREFDFIDIGQIIPTSGAVPVVIKSLVFPATAGLGRPV
ncbi:MAG: ethanolamine ammonia-lyase reactivating factor EutA [Dehalococcoidia bacterium]